MNLSCLMHSILFYSIVLFCCVTRNLERRVEGWGEGRAWVPSRSNLSAEKKIVFLNQSLDCPYGCINDRIVSMIRLSASIVANCL